MKNYYVQNGKIVVSKYCVEYAYTTDNLSSKSTTNVKQFVKNNDELTALLSELNSKGIEYTATELDVADIQKFDGVFVGSDDEARRLIEPTLDEVKTDKIKEISQACEQTIFNGVDVALSSGETKHFSLKIEDQMNLNGLVSQVSLGNIKAEDGVPYHADGEICTMFSIADFTLVANMASAFKVQQTTYCNHLMSYVKSLADIKEVQGVTYGQQLTGEFLESYNKIMGVLNE